MAEHDEPEAPEAPEQGPEYMMADAAYDARGFADDAGIDDWLMEAYDDRNGDPGYFDGWE